MRLPGTFDTDLGLIHQHLVQCVRPSLPTTLREPILYFLNMPGKHIRPLLTLYACQAIGGKREDAIHAAIAAELFHDFTLVHDDIMDMDEMRRGFEAVHVKYGNSTAILAGDAMIGLAFEQLMHSPPACINPLVHVFSEALVKVCEGQALDKEFESREEVSLDDYIDMISKKTAWLIRAACTMGAYCGRANAGQVKHLGEFGFYLGLGFQILDDLLDFVADEAVLGKKVGSDFQMHKNTFVTLAYQQRWREEKSLQKKYPRRPSQFEEFSRFQAALRAMGVVEEVQDTAEIYHQKALSSLRSVIDLDESNPLYQLTRFLQQRQY